MATKAATEVKVERFISNLFKNAAVLLLGGLFLMLAVGVLQSNAVVPGTLDYGSAVLVMFLVAFIIRTSARDNKKV